MIKKLALEEKERKLKENERKRKTELFRGIPLAQRSEKPEFKFVEEKEEILDEQTQMEKDYLDSELFVFLQEAKETVKEEALQDYRP